MQAQHASPRQGDNQKQEVPSRLEELIEQYETPVKAIVHQLLESFVREEFEAFIGPRIGETLNRASDGQEVIVKLLRPGVRVRFVEQRP